MNARRTTIIFLLVLLLIVASLAFAITSSFLRPVAFAIILAVVFYPLHERILGWTKQRAGWASLLSTLTLLFMFGVPVVIILLMAANEALRSKHSIRHTTIQVEHPSRFVRENCYDCAPEQD